MESCWMSFFKIFKRSSRRFSSDANFAEESIFAAGATLCKDGRQIFAHELSVSLNMLKLSYTHNQYY